MTNLDRLFDDWFADPQFSPAEKLSFGADLRARLAQNNATTAFDGVLAEVDGLLTLAGGATGDEATALAVRKAAVAAKKTHLEVVRDAVSRREGRVRDQFGKDSPAYLEFYPQGITPYRLMKEADVEPKLAVLIAAGHKHLPALETEFTALRTTWTALRTAASGAIGGVGAVNVSQNDALSALGHAMQKAILTAALTFLCQPAMGPALFDQSRLYNRKPGAGPALPPTP